jgi:L-asparaginase
VLPTLPAGIRRSVVAAACLAAILIAGCSAVAAAAPRVRLVATGGTIGNARDGRWNADALAASAPNLSEIARVETETFARGPSLSLSLEDWVRLARRLNQIAADGDLDGIVVTSGTDSLEEVAWFLDLTVRTPKPVVVTGAMRKPGEADSDGPANLEDAVRLAASPAARGRGTLVMFHGLVLSARDVEKASTVKVEAFDAGAHLPLGRVSAGVVTLTAENPRRHGTTSEFDIGQIARLARVDVLLTYQAAPGDLAEAAIAKGARGLVMAAAGAGALSMGEISGVNAALKAGVPVVVASRVEDGHVSLIEGGAAPGLIAAGDLAPLKARILLMLALSKGLDVQGLGRVFREY